MCRVPCVAYYDDFGIVIPRVLAIAVLRFPAGPNDTLFDRDVNRR